MRKIKFLLLFLIIFISLFAWTFVVLAADDIPADASDTGPAATTDTTTTTDSGVYNLEIPIFEYSQSQNIAEYIITIYRYSMIVLIPILIVVIILGGIFWISAAGDSGRIKKAKDRIISGFIGLGLALASYVILSLVGINALNMPSLQKITRIEGDDLSMYGENSTMPNSPGSYQAIGGQCFPVGSTSFVENRHNFKEARRGGGRIHCGVDLITKEPGYGIAIADGTVTAITTSFIKIGQCTKQQWFKQKYGIQAGGKIMIYHPSLNVTVNYAEISDSTIKLKVGDNVKAGQILGVFGPCGMLHFELYKGNQSNSTAWYPGQPQPENLLDPTNTLDALQSKMCGGT